MDYTLGAIGGGVVGQAIKAFYPRLLIYDKFKNFDSLEAVKSCDIIFICVPTPYSGGFDDSMLLDAMANLSDASKSIIVIKSTVPPGTTESLQKQYPQLSILFNPEFLTSSVAADDFAHPDKQIIGFTDVSRSRAEILMSILPKAPFQKIVPAREAELLKYAVNNYYALKVSFANQLYDIARALDVDYDSLRQMLASDKRMIDSHLDVFHGGYRGFGGACLPKDLDTIIDLAESAGVNPLLYKAAKYYNEALLPKDNDNDSETA